MSLGLKSFFAFFFTVMSRLRLRLANTPDHIQTRILTKHDTDTGAPTQQS